MRINYHVKKVVEVAKSSFIENENFICIEHLENGIKIWTAFIGVGEMNIEKKVIKISPSGGVFEISRMAGDAIFNAEILLKKDGFNKVLQNEAFISLYREQKKRLVIDL